MPSISIRASVKHTPDTFDNHDTVDTVDTLDSVDTLDTLLSRSSTKWYTVNTIWKHSVFAYPKREHYCFNRFCFEMARQITLSTELSWQPEQVDERYICSKTGNYPSPAQLSRVNFRKVNNVRFCEEYSQNDWHGDEKKLKKTGRAVNFSGAGQISLESVAESIQIVESAFYPYHINSDKIGTMCHV
jgi:hypothetical protein